MEQKVSLGSVRVPEENYKADLELMDRCQAYAAELVRLALLGVAGLGFLFVQLASSQNAPVLLKDPLAVLIFFSRCSFSFGQLDSVFSTATTAGRRSGAMCAQSVV